MQHERQSRYALDQHARKACSQNQAHIEVLPERGDVGRPFFQRALAGDCLHQRFILVLTVQLDLIRVRHKACIGPAHVVNRLYPRQDVRVHGDDLCQIFHQQTSVVAVDFNAIVCQQDYFVFVGQRGARDHHALPAAIFKIRKPDFFRFIFHVHQQLRRHDGDGTCVFVFIFCPDLYRSIHAIN